MAPQSLRCLMVGAGGVLLAAAASAYAPHAALGLGSAAGRLLPGELALRHPAAAARARAGCSAAVAMVIPDGGDAGARNEGKKGPEGGRNRGLGRRADGKAGTVGARTLQGRSWGSSGGAAGPRGQGKEGRGGGRARGKGGRGGRGDSAAGRGARLPTLSGLLSVPGAECGHARVHTQQALKSLTLRPKPYALAHDPGPLTSVSGACILYGLNAPYCPIASHPLAASVASVNATSLNALYPTPARVYAPCARDRACA
jgi:hypothetical protein